MSRTLLFKLNTRPIRAITLALFLLSGIFFANLTHASFLTEYFDFGYNPDTLSGQGNWLSNYFSTSTPAISGDYYKSSFYSAKIISALVGDAYYNGNETASGTLAFWFYMKSDTGAVGDSINLYLSDSTSTQNNLPVRFACYGGNCSQWGGIAQFYDFYGWNLIGYFNLDSWNYLIINFNCNTNNVYFNLNGSTAEGNFNSICYNINYLTLTGGNFEKINFYIDNIGTIIETEPPPPPEAESCEGLELLERLVCEIKNTLAGAFLPSQNKINDLKNNLNLIQQKFPFNYINEAGDFFTDLKAGIGATSTISFKVLDKPGVVDFSIWEKSVNLAGSTQTFADILKGLSSGFVLFAFIVWAIGFGKRIFK